MRNGMMTIALVVVAGFSCGHAEHGDTKAKVFDSASVKEQSTLVTVVDTSLSSALVPQSICPIMKEPINKKLFVDGAGVRIYVCCKGCIAKIAADPEKYVKILADLGQKPEPIPAEKQ